MTTSKKPLIVEKKQFDSLLSKLIKAKPEPRKKITLPNATNGEKK